MNDEILERLVLDQSLGALQPDVQELLGAYVKTRPDTAQHLAIWQQTADIARAAMSPIPIETLPPLRAQNSNPRIMRMAQATLSIVAALLLGLAIGMRLPHNSQPRQAIVAQSAPIQPATPPITAVTDFWSSQRLLAMATHQKQTPQTTDTLR